jgi:hypothetical protein
MAQKISAISQPYVQELVKRDKLNSTMMTSNQAYQSEFEIHEKLSVEQAPKFEKKKIPQIALQYAKECYPSYSIFFSFLCCSISILFHC